MSVTISPKIGDKGEAQIRKLKRGDCFVTGDSIYQLNDNDPVAHNFKTGQYVDFDGGEWVTPVDITITWKPKVMPTKKKK